MGKIVGTLGLRFPSTIAKQNRVELYKERRSWAYQVYQQT